MNLSIHFQRTSLFLPFLKGRPRAAAQAMPTLFEMPAATPADTVAEPAPVATPSSVASENSLFELAAELDFLLEQIEDEI